MTIVFLEVSLCVSDQCSYKDYKLGDLKTIHISYLFIFIYLASLVPQTLKNLPVMQETQVQSLGWENPPGKGNGNLLQ